MKQPKIMRLDKQYGIEANAADRKLIEQHLAAMVQSEAKRTERDHASKQAMVNEVRRQLQAAGVRVPDEVAVDIKSVSAKKGETAADKFLANLKAAGERQKSGEVELGPDGKPIRAAVTRTARLHARRINPPKPQVVKK